MVWLMQKRRIRLGVVKFEEKKVVRGVQSGGRESGWWLKKKLSYCENEKKSGGGGGSSQGGQGVCVNEELKRCLSGWGSGWL